MTAQKLATKSISMRKQLSKLEERVGRQHAHIVVLAEAVRRQTVSINALLNLLMEKNVITREEMIAEAEKVAAAASEAVEGAEAAPREG